MNVMILAAGEGTRLRPYTKVLPKPAMPFLTIPLAAHTLGFLRGQTIDSLVVNTYYLPDKIHGLFRSLPHEAKALHFSDETGELLGSGGGLGKARKYFLGGGDFLMMNADEVILPQDEEILSKALAHHKKTKALATLLVMDHPGIGTQFGGVWCDSQNKVLGFGKEPIAASQRAWHFVGVQIFSEKVFSYIPENGASNILYDSLVAGIQKGESVQAFPMECRWFETGNPTDFLDASKECFKYLWAEKDSFEKKQLLKNLSQFGENNLRFENTGAAQLIMSPNAIVNSAAQLEGLIVVAKGAAIEERCRLKNCIVASGVVVKAGTEASNTLFLE